MHLTDGLTGPETVLLWLGVVLFFVSTLILIFLLLKTKTFKTQQVIPLFEHYFARPGIHRRYALCIEISRQHKEYRSAE